MRTRNYAYVSLAGCALLLAACGGGGNHGHDTAGQTPPPTGQTPPPAANAPPSVTDLPATATVDEDASSDPIAFKVSDAETAADSIKLSVESSNADLLPVDGIRVIGNGTDRALMLTPNSGTAGSSHVILTATDDSGATAQQSMDVAVASTTQSFKAMVDTAFKEDAESQGEDLVGYQWTDNPEDDETAFDHLTSE